MAKKKLAQKMRTKRFGSRKMCIAEWSPAASVENSLRLYEGATKALLRRHEGSTKALFRLYEGAI